MECPIFRIDLRLEIQINVTKLQHCIKFSSIQAIKQIFRTDFRLEIQINHKFIKGSFVYQIK